MKDELGERIITEIIAVRPKTYAYQIDDDEEVKKAKGTKKYVIKKSLNLMIYNEIVIKSQRRFKSERHDVYTEEVNKIALRSSDDKRLQTFVKITTYPYGTSVCKVCKAELLGKVNIK